MAFLGAIIGSIFAVMVLAVIFFPKIVKRKFNRKINSTQLNYKKQSAVTKYRLQGMNEKDANRKAMLDLIQSGDSGLFGGKK